MKITKLLLLIFFPLFVQGQNPSLVQLGGYAGVGYFNSPYSSSYGGKSRARVGYDIGMSTIIHYSMIRKSRIELGLNFMSSDRDIKNLTLDLNFHIPLYYRDNYRLLLVPGLILGIDFVADYRKFTYQDVLDEDTGENYQIILEEVMDKPQTWYKYFALGISLGIRQEFRLTEGLYAVMNVRPIARTAHHTYVQGAIIIEGGVYTYLYSRKNKKIQSIDGANIDF